MTTSKKPVAQEPITEPLPPTQEPQETTQITPDTQETEATAETQPLSETETTPTTEVLPDQVPPSPPPADRDPQDWTEPSWDKGMFPGDPNTYPDPDNEMRSP